MQKYKRIYKFYKVLYYKKESERRFNFFSKYKKLFFLKQNKSPNSFKREN